jgi:hypothetical protein
MSADDPTATSTDTITSRGGASMKQRAFLGYSVGQCRIT